MSAIRFLKRRGGAGLIAALAGALVSLAGPAAPAMAASYVPISGSGSSWAYNAIHAWQGSVTQFGMVVNYSAVGSTVGRNQFKDGTVDWAASDIPYGVQDGSNFDPLPLRGFAYIPDVAGGTTFAYNLRTGTQQVTNLRLSGENIAKIFTGVLTRWDDPAIAADNPGLSLPSIAIVPVVRSDGSGPTAQFTQWMAATQGQYWTAYCARVGRSPCTPTSAYPVLSGSNMVGQPGDLGVVGYVRQAQAVGTIGYAEYSYAVQAALPVAKMLNAAGYYTEPTAGHVGVSLLAARINMDPSNPNTYLTQDLSGVYTNPDPRTYELSSYSYLIVPTDTSFSFNTNKGFTLGDFGKYLLCQGQTQVDALGYSALPINLVEAGFAQLQKIPGAIVPTATTDMLRSCNNPTFSTDGTNTLANNDPMPLPCDKQGATQCGAGAEGETVDVNIPSAEGFLTMTVSSAPVQLGNAVLSADYASFAATGQLGAVTISDSRNQSQPGWSISGQVGDFSDGSHTFSGSYLGWTPTVTSQNPANDVVAGPAVTPGTNPGLAGGGELADAAATKGLGVTVLGASLDLIMPSSTGAGAYSVTLTVTAVVSG